MTTTPLDLSGSQGANIGNYGPITQYFLQAGYTSLAELYIAPDAVYERVRSQTFVGRSWLIAQIDAFLHDPNRKRGVLVLEGEAGVGKSALMAHLVQQRNYLHLFAEQLRGDANVSRALQSLGSQIVTRHQLQEYTQRDTLPAIAGFPDFLERLLRNAASKLQANEKIVIVCDALDEAGVAANSNVFGLPQVLPDGVYLLLSQRPQPVALSFKNITPQIIHLDPTSAENRGDVQAYLRQAASQPALAQQLAERGYSAERFVTILAERSGGVWMYLQYVIDEIARGERAPLDLERLPPGLAGYYADYWGQWRAGQRGEGKAAWRTLYAPLLSTLAAAQAPLPLARLRQWAGIGPSQHDDYELRDLLAHQWQAFVTAARREGEATTAAHFSLYHASLRDFLSGNVATSNLLSAARALVDELQGRALDAHVRIVEALRQQCAGDWVKLVDDGYARRHLAGHLHAAGERNPEWQQELAALVAESNRWAEARYAVEEGYNGYLVDLNLLWQHANSAVGWNIGIQLRCALIQSSIFSLADNLPPELVALAVAAKRWSPVRALAHLSQVQTEWKRSETLTYLVPHLPAALKDEALIAACAIGDESWRASALSGIAPHLPTTLQGEVLVAIRAIVYEWSRASALRKLAPHLPTALQCEAINEALVAAHAIANESNRAYALIELAPHLPDALLRETLDEALAATRAIADKSWRASILSEIISHLPDTLKNEVINEALATARAIVSETDRISALSKLAPHLPAGLKDETIREALAVAYAIAEEFSRASALSKLVPHLPDALQGEVIQEALVAVRAIMDDSRRAAALTELASHLPAALHGKAIDEALVATHAIGDEQGRASALSKFVPHLPDSLQGEALTTALAILNEFTRAFALSDLAPYLPDALQDEAVAAARAFVSEWSRVIALSGLAPCLPDTLQGEVIQEALVAARTIVSEYWRASALNRLIPHLPGALQSEVIQEALAAVRAIADESWRASALHELVLHLPDALQGEALVVARAIANEWIRASALSRLVPHLPKPLQGEVIQEALAAARVITDESRRAFSLRDLAPHLSAVLQGEALAIAHAIVDEWSRVTALSELAPHLPTMLKSETIDKALAAAHAITNESRRADALGMLAPHLSAALQGEVLVAAHAIANEFSRAEALSRLALYLDNSLKSEIATSLFVNVTLQHTTNIHRTQTLRNLIEAWSATGFAGYERQVYWLPALAALARNTREELLKDLVALLPLLQHIGGEQAIGELFLALRDVARWWP